MEIVREDSYVEISLREFNINTPSRLHWHDRFELLRIEKDCDFIIEGEHVEAHTGDIIAINERDIHRFLPKAEGYVIEILQFPIKIILDADAKSNTIKTFITSEQIKSVEGLCETVNFLFSTIKHEGDSYADNSNSYLRSIVASLYLLLARHFPKDESSNTANKDRKEFYKIIEYINEHFAEDILIQNICTKLFVSRVKINSLFSTFAGTSPAAYIRSLRIKNVNRLLSQGHSVTEAAYESGFQNIRTFNYAYKRIFGYAPSEYLKNKTKS